MNYEQTGLEWAYELEPEDTSFLKKAGLLDRLKDKGEEGRKPYINLRKPEKNKDGETNEPIRIYDAENEPWDGRLIGNGSTVVAKLSIVDWGKGKKKSIYTNAVRVEDLISYESNEFASFDGSDKPVKSKPKAKPLGKTVLEELDEDEPF